MGHQFSIVLRNARLNSIESMLGAGAVLKIRTGPKPANCEAADAGSVVSTLLLPADWMSDAVAGVKVFLGAWQDLLADATGTAGHFRFYETTGTTCHWQGDVTLTGGGGAMTLDNTVMEAGQQIVVTALSLTDGNA